MLLVFFMVLCWFVCLLTVFWVVNVLLFGVLCYLGYLVVFSDGMDGRFGLVCCDFAVGITFVSLVDAALGLLVWLCIVGLWFCGVCGRVLSGVFVCYACYYLRIGYFAHIGVTVMIPWVGYYLGVIVVGLLVYGLWVVFVVMFGGCLVSV